MIHICLSVCLLYYSALLHNIGCRRTYVLFIPILIVFILYYIILYYIILYYIILYYITDSHISLLLVRLRRFILYYVRLHSYSGAVGWDTAIQTGRSRVRIQNASLGFFTQLILPAALWPWDRLSLYQKWELGYLLCGKRVPCLGLTVLPPSLADCLTNLGNSAFSKQPSGPLQACTGIDLSLQTFENILCRARLSQIWLRRWLTGIVWYFFFLNKLNRKSARNDRIKTNLKFCMECVIRFSIRVQTCFPNLLYCLDYAFSCYFISLLRFLVFILLISY